MIRPVVGNAWRFTVVLWLENDMATFVPYNVFCGGGVEMYLECETIL